MPSPSSSWSAGSSLARSPRSARSSIPFPHSSRSPTSPALDECGTPIRRPNDEGHCPVTEDNNHRLRLLLARRAGALRVGRGHPVLRVAWSAGRPGSRRSAGWHARVLALYGTDDGAIRVLQSSRVLVGALEQPDRIVEILVETMAAKPAD